MSAMAPLDRPKVFVHGNPESAAIWGPLTDELRSRGCTRVIHLSPPGFGAPVPSDWSANQADYREWLVSEVAAFDTAIDLVGHDWGAGHVYGLLTERPHQVTTWAADCGGLVHADYTWHDAALAWQTPEVGEAMIDGLVELSVDDRTAAFVGLGMPIDVARWVATAVDATMGRCILALYRSAAQPSMRELGVRLAALGPHHGGAVIVPTADSYPGTPDMAREVATTLGASVVELEGRGHWWMLEDPSGAADALVSFWSGHGR
jgi:pimeloyl-ACP methyl ester carboxylesterase